MNILVVDDEKEIADVVELYLQNDQYKVFKFYNGQDALDCINSTKIDLAILDIMLPDIDGFQILKQIRQKYTFPVIMLTAKTIRKTIRSQALTWERMIIFRNRSIHWSWWRE